MSGGDRSTASLPIPSRSFKDLVREGAIREGEYNTNDNDLVSEFYSPILGLAKSYDRSTGAFSVAGIKTLAQPLVHFIRNAVDCESPRPVMRIVASHDISDLDYDQITGGYQKRYSTPEDRLVAILKSLKDSSDQELLRAVRNIGTMVQLGLLDIKVAIPVEKLGGIYHRKIGIFEDFHQNTVTFEGSQNISRSGDGSERNLEGFVAFCSDDPLIQKFKSGHIRFFANLWEDKLENVRVRPLDKYPRELLASYGVPLETIIQEIGASIPPIILPTPRECQREAVLGWIQNGHRGILDMCTGSGKSRAALLALDHLEEPPLTILITGNLIDLVNQWAENEITPNYGKTKVHIVRVSSEHGNREELERRVSETMEDFRFYSKEGKRVFIVSTIQSASQEWFRNLAKRFGSTRLALVLDEVHHAGASGPTGDILKIQADYRIGLSATWRRYDDDENGRLEDYFKGKRGPVAYSYTLSDGIEDGILSEYKYFLHPVPIESDDLAELRKRLTEYDEELRKIDPSLGIQSGDKVLGVLPSAKLPRILELRNRWRNALGKALAKTDVALQIVDKEAPNLKKCIIYCADRQQLDRTSTLMGQRHYDLEPYDSQVPEETRRRIREKFGGQYQGQPMFVGAIKCLDEGIDLPALDSAILVASNRTEREWIQRRGRILRKYQGKAYSTIHDVIMLPYANERDAFQLTKQEKGYVEAELDRLESFGRDALNRADVIQEINRLKGLFGVG
jgi:superfamily II DNA or RNA helicase